jgi:hypothetical protein
VPLTVFLLKDFAWDMRNSYENSLAKESIYSLKNVKRDIKIHKKLEIIILVHFEENNDA